MHLAGDFDDASILELSPQRLIQVLAGRAKGAWLLHEQTRDLDLDFFVLFSSSVSVLGSARQIASRHPTRFSMALRSTGGAKGSPLSASTGDRQWPVQG